MRDYITILLFAGAFLLATATLLATNPKYVRRATIGAGIAAAVAGLLLYGYGYIATIGSTYPAAIQAFFSVCRMFIGESDYSEISEAALFQLKWVNTLFWVIHILAFYTTVSAAVSAVGEKALQRIRLLLARYGEIRILYGVNKNSLDFGRELAASGKGLMVYVDENPDPALVYAIQEASFLVYSDDQALTAAAEFLKRIGIKRKKQKITLFALSEDCAKNMQYAKKMIHTLDRCQIPPENTSLVIHAGENLSVSGLQSGEQTYGYGFVTAFQEQGLTARLLVQNYPPCNYISFDGTGKATEDFHVLMIGFGQLGQAVLKQLIMNGQFVGSRFRAAVFSPDCSTTNGFFLNSCRSIPEHYDISFHPHDGRSEQLYDYLAAHCDTIKYIVIHTGQEMINGEIAEEISQYVGNMGLNIPVFQCSYEGIRANAAGTQDTVQCAVYRPEVLCTQNLDKLAMVINQYYQGENSRGALQDWLNCDYFSRLSCRASADYMNALLRASGRTEQQAAAGDWNFSKEHLENLSKMEHMRWCAFHHCMGFTRMSDEEYAARADRYLEQMVRKETPAIRIGKNMENKTHACLINWEELDALSEREAAITGKTVNYKQLDTDNVMLIPKLLQIKNDLQGSVL